MLNFDKYDKFGQKLNIGDVCVVSRKKTGIEFCVYKGVTNGNKSKGAFGRFSTNHGVISIKFTSVVFVFDPLTDRRAKVNEVNGAIRSFYEGIR